MKYNPGYTYKINDSISGLYHGIYFNGIVFETRRHTQRHDLTELRVKLNNPITVYGTDRETILLMILDDGSEL